MPKKRLQVIRSTKGYTLEMRKAFGDKIYVDLSDPTDEYAGVLLFLTEAQIRNLIRDLGNVLAGLSPKGPTL